MIRTVAIRLKIPDNEAYTALSALRRLGVPVTRLERAEIWQFEDDGAEQDFLERVERIETLFNPNKHELHLLEEGQPRAGEAWIEELDANRATPRRYVGWRLFSDGHTPAEPKTVQSAVDLLLCNPAIERAITEG